MMNSENTNSNIRPSDANALFDALYNNEFQTFCPLDEVSDVIAAAPTIDYAPVIHASWVGIEYDGYADGCPVYDLWECSHCKHEHKGEIDTLTEYCPDCGAKMDGGKKDG